MKKITNCQHFYEIAFISSFSSIGETNANATVICRKCGDVKRVKVVKEEREIKFSYGKVKGKKYEKA